MANKMGGRRQRPLLATWTFVFVASLVPALASASYLEAPAARDFAARMAAEHGFDRSVLNQWLGSAEKQQKIIDAISRPAEKALEWKAYRSIFLGKERAEAGKAFIDQHRQAFDRAEAEPGLSRYIAAAIIGVETRYGQYLGSYRVIDALATLSFNYPPRSTFFTRELEQFLLLAREQGLDPLALKGSYAGAMGYGQFIPSSYRAYAIDFDDDGVVNILNNPVDAIGSVANYFARHGWKPEQPVAERVEVTAEQAKMAEDALKPKRSLGEFRAAGIEVGADLPDKSPARLLRLEGSAGPEFWLTYTNFYVITRYNHSSLYAMAVLQLSQAMQGEIADDA